MLVELMRLAGGGGAELARRWVAALMSVPATERRALVEEVERRIGETYGSPSTTPASDADQGDPQEGEQLMHLVEPPVQKRGYTEQVIRTYAAGDPPHSKSAQKTQRASSARRRKSSG